MKFVTPEISWHDRDPVYSVDFQYLEGNIRRLASCGTDRQIRIWNVKFTKDGKSELEFLSTLNRHTRTVNVVRFSPNGETLASGADDNTIFLWKLNPIPPSATLFQEDEDTCQENWSVFKQLRSHLEDVYDLCWSSDGLHLLSGSVDNSAILWDVKKGQKLWLFSDHKSFVQGVAFDPLGKYLATMSSDRICRIYQATHAYNLVQELKKFVLPNGKFIRMFQDDTMKSFFRRLSFSPDGRLLVVPAGCVENASGETINTTFIFARDNFSRPVLHLPVGNKAAIAVRFCPLLFQLREVPCSKTDKTEVPSDHQKEEWEKYETLFALPYRMAFAVITENSIILYDTQQIRPFALLSNVHYHTLSDVTWSHDGRILVVASTDGYCTLVTFEEGELGQPYRDQVVRVKSSEQSTMNIEQVQENFNQELKLSDPVEVQKKTSRGQEGNNPGQTGSSRRVQVVTLSSGPTVVPSSSSENPPAPAVSRSQLLSSPVLPSLSASIQPILVPPSTHMSSASSPKPDHVASSSATSSLAPSSSSRNSKPPRRVSVMTIASDSSAKTTDEAARRVQPTTLTVATPSQLVDKPSEMDPDKAPSAEPDRLTEPATVVKNVAPVTSPMSTVMSPDTEASEFHLFLEMSDESNMSPSASSEKQMEHSTKPSPATSHPRRVVPVLLEPLATLQQNSSKTCSLLQEPCNASAPEVFEKLVPPFDPKPPTTAIEKNPRRIITTFLEPLPTSEPHPNI